MWRAEYFSVLLAGRGLQGKRCCSKEPGAVGWDLIEQVKAAKSSIQTDVPLIRAFLEGGERLQAFRGRLDVGICQLFAYCLSIGDLLQVLK